MSYDNVEHSGISQFEFRVSDWEIFISTKLTEAFIVEYAAKHLDWIMWLKSLNNIC